MKHVWGMHDNKKRMCQLTTTIAVDAATLSPQELENRLPPLCCCSGPVLLSQEPPPWSEWLNNGTCNNFLILGSKCWWASSGRLRNGPCGKRWWNRWLSWLPPPKTPRWLKEIDDEVVSLLLFEWRRWLWFWTSLNVLPPLHDVLQLLLLLCWWRWNRFKLKFPGW